MVKLPTSTWVCLIIWLQLLTPASCYCRSLAGKDDNRGGWVPAAFVGNLNCIPGSQFWPSGPIVGIWEWTSGCELSFSVPLHMYSSSPSDVKRNPRCDYLLPWWSSSLDIKVLESCPLIQQWEFQNLFLRSKGSATGRTLMKAPKAPWHLRLLGYYKANVKRLNLSAMSDLDFISSFFSLCISNISCSSI